MIDELATISFTDVESGDDGIVILRAGKGVVGLCLSLRKNGDVQVFLTKQDCDRVLDALQKSLLIARGQSSPSG